jgi:hypothetical protein
VNRFPSDLDLSYLVGRDLSFIGIDQFSLYLTLNGEVLSADRGPTGILENVVMDSDVKICIEGSWNLADGSGGIVDESMEHAERKSYRIHLLLGLKLLSYRVFSDTTLKLTFEKNFCLSVIDDSEIYETVSIEYGDTRIVV